MNLTHQPEGDGMAAQIVTPAGATVGWNLAQDRNSAGEVFTTVTLRLVGAGVEIITDDGRGLSAVSCLEVLPVAPDSTPIAGQ